MFRGTYLKYVISLVKSCKLCFVLRKYAVKCKKLPHLKKLCRAAFFISKGIFSVNIKIENFKRPVLEKKMGLVD